MAAVDDPLFGRLNHDATKSRVMLAHTPTDCCVLAADWAGKVTPRARQVFDSLACFFLQDGFVFFQQQCLACFRCISCCAIVC